MADSSGENSGDSPEPFVSQVFLQLQKQKNKKNELRFIFVADNGNIKDTGGWYKLICYCVCLWATNTSTESEANIPEPFSGPRDLS